MFLICVLIDVMMANPPPKATQSIVVFARDHPERDSLRSIPQVNTLVVMSQQITSVEIE
jgi:hypothetical protein